MDIVCQIVCFFKSHPIELIGLLIAYLSLIVPINQYIHQRKLEEKDKRFNNYHKLIEGLVGTPERGANVDRITAIIFELRNYPEYYEVTQRILTGLKNLWINQEVTKGVTNEMEITLNIIKKKKRFSFLNLLTTYI